MANPVDSITHHKFQTDRTEIVERKQIQDRGTHTYRQQMKDPVLQTDLQSDLQKDPHLNLQDLQVKMDLQSNLQEKPPLDLQEDLQVDLQMDLKVKTGLEGTQSSSSVSFPLQAETSTEERSTSTFM